MRTLEELLRDVDVVSVNGDCTGLVHHISRDSRHCGPHTVFVAVAGASVDGHAYVSSVDALAVVVERDVEVAPGIAVVRVENTKLALAQLACALHQHPSMKLPVIGITGTNGKTTMTTLVARGLEELGWRVGRIGTTGNTIAGVPRPTQFTTPEAPELQQMLAEMVTAGCEAVLMEVSSIGLSQRRVDGTRFHAAVFTNLTQDHLDFHGTMEAYGRAKARLFEELLRPAGGEPRAILCIDDPAHEAMGAPEDRLTYGFDEQADILIESVEMDAAGSVMGLETAEGSVSLHSPMLGRHNAQNLAGAVAVMQTLGIDPFVAAAALGRVRAVPGRLERVGDSPLVVVDYAHSPDALKAALRTLRPYAHDGRLWVVMGCGGDRDAAKRPLMGRIAEELGDVVVLTSDNPRSEQPQEILHDIRAGLAADPALIDEDRGRAIQWAVRTADESDVVLIAGKGHETYQEINGVRHPFDDREVARQVLSVRRGQSGI